MKLTKEKVAEWLEIAENRPIGLPGVALAFRYSEDRANIAAVESFWEAARIGFEPLCREFLAREEARCD